MIVTKEVTEEEVLACTQEIVKAANKIAKKYSHPMVAGAMFSQGICGMLDAGADPHALVRFFLETVDTYKTDKENDHGST
jgi:hypothetical protein